jgi:EmrB/QacA subfamily drug resistance transporter
LTGRRRTAALVALTLGVMLVTINVTVVVVSLPSISRSLHAAPDQAAWIIDAYNLVGASLLLSAGFLADRFGRRRLLIAGYVLFCSGAALCAAAASVSALLAFRIVQALGGTALTPTSLAIVANLYPEPRERARAIGIWGIASGVGTGLGPIIGGGVTDWLGWRWVFVINAAVGLTALVIVIFVVPASRSATTRRIDLAGQVLAATSLATLTFALIEAPGNGWGSATTILLLALSATLGVLFLTVELRVDEPLIDPRFFRDRQFSAAVLITVVVFFVFGGFVYENAIYLQEGRGYSALAAGLLTLPAALPTLVGGPIAGQFVATRGARGILTAGTGMMTLAMIILSQLPGDASVAALICSYTVLGIGYAVINAPISTVAVASMPRDQAGVAAAVASSGRNVGIVLGVAVLGSIVTTRLATASGPTTAADAYASALGPAYAVAALFGLLAVIAAITSLRNAPPGVAT